MEEKLVNNQLERQWKNIYIMGGCAAFLAFTGVLFDIVFGSVSSSNLSEFPQTAVERFSEFQQSWFLGLYHLDLLNTIIAIIMLPVYFALFAVHRKINPAYAAFAMVFSIMGTTIFVSTNSALPMLELSNKYYLATDETQKLLIAAAGEAMLAKGGHGSLGVFIGFVLSTLASIFISLVMLGGKIFSSRISYLGIIGYTLLLIYILLITFVTQIEHIAVIIAAPGGLLALAWVFIVGIKLIKLGVYNTTQQ